MSALFSSWGNNYLNIEDFYHLDTAKGVFVTVGSVTANFRLLFVEKNSKSELNFRTGKP
jgi:hypothetical protein